MVESKANDCHLLFYQSLSFVEFSICVEAEAELGNFNPPLIDVKVLPSYHSYICNMCNWFSALYIVQWHL